MSTALILVIVLGGAALVLGATALLVVLILRHGRRHAAPSTEQTRAGIEARGWSLAARDDSWIPLFDRQHDRREWAHPLRRPPRATAATDVITGTHRGRRFVATTFATVHGGEHRLVRAIWVQAPASHPMLTATRIIGPQNAMNRAIGRGGVQTGIDELDRRFEIICDDREFARSVFSPELVSLLLHDERPFRGIALRGECVDVFDPVSDHRDPLELERALDLRCDILERIPMWRG